MNPQTWVASGHLGGFSDPLMDCKECHERFRADKIIEDFAEENHIELKGSVDGWTQEEMKNFIADNNVPCPTCGKHNFTDIRQFNLMFKTFQGVTEDAKIPYYLRPETAQVFRKLQKCTAYIQKENPVWYSDKSVNLFRNEITPGNFYISVPESSNRWSLSSSASRIPIWSGLIIWRNFCINWLKSLGMKEEEMRVRDHDQEEFILLQ